MHFANIEEIQVGKLIDSFVDAVRWGVILLCYGAVQDFGSVDETEALFVISVETITS